MKRRTFLKAIASIPLVSLIPWSGVEAIPKKISIKGNYVDNDIDKITTERGNFIPVVSKKYEKCLSLMSSLGEAAAKHKEKIAVNTLKGRRSHEKERSIKERVGIRVRAFNPPEAI